MAIALASVCLQVVDLQQALDVERSKTTPSRAADSQMHAHAGDEGLQAEARTHRSKVAEVLVLSPQKPPVCVSQPGPTGAVMPLQLGAFCLGRSLSFSGAAWQPARSCGMDQTARPCLGVLTRQSGHNKTVCNTVASIMHKFVCVLGVRGGRRGGGNAPVQSSATQAVVQVEAVAHARYRALEKKYHQLMAASIDGGDAVAVAAQDEVHRLRQRVDTLQAILDAERGRRPSSGLAGVDQAGGCRHSAVCHTQ